MPGFVHLHVASGYSLRYGTAQPEALAVRAAELGQDALALTDRDGAYGAVAFALACREVGISPILGADLAVAPQESPVGPPRPRPGAPARGGTSVDPGHPRVVLLARGASGWASLCRVISMAHLTGDRGRPVVTLAGIADPSAARRAAPWTASAPLQATLAVAEAARSSQAVSCTLPG